MTTTTKIRIALLAINVLIVGWLLYVAVSSFISIQGVAELSAAERSREIYGHVLFPLAGVVVVAGLAGIGWFVIGAFAQIAAFGGLTKPAPSPNQGRDLADKIIKQVEQDARSGTIPSPPTATVITLREPNIDLSITLTGDAAKDSVGRKKIGAVMEHYGSGTAEEKNPAAEGGAV